MALSLVAASHPYPLLNPAAAEASLDDTGGLLLVHEVGARNLTHADLRTNLPGGDFREVEDLADDRWLRRIAPNGELVWTEMDGRWGMPLRLSISPGAIAVLSREAGGERWHVRSPAGAFLYEFEVSGFAPLAADEVGTYCASLEGTCLFSPGRWARDLPLASIAIAAQPLGSGRLAVALWTGISESTSIHLLDRDGTLQETHAMPQANFSWLLLVTDGSGGLLAAWVSSSYEGPGTAAVYVGRLAADGTWLLGHRHPLGRILSLAALALDPEGGIVAFGTRGAPGDADAFMLRLRPDAFCSPNCSPSWVRSASLGVSLRLTPPVDVRGPSMALGGNVDATGHIFMGIKPWDRGVPWGMVRFLLRDRPVLVEYTTP